MMKRIVLYFLLCILCLAGLGPALAASPETDPAEWPDVPFARNIATGNIIYLGMDRAEAQAIAGEPDEEGNLGRPLKNNHYFDGLTLAFRDDVVVFIEIPYEKPHWFNDEWVPFKTPRWLANGVAKPYMSMDQALKALGMSSETEIKQYRLIYFEDGSRAQWDRKMFQEGLSDYQWEITLHGDGQTVWAIWMGDKQYLMTYQ